MPAKSDASAMPLLAGAHKLLRYYRGNSGVWIARRRELAPWALEGDHDEITNARRFFPTTTPD